jgi:hypothetical protein
MSILSVQHKLSLTTHTYAKLTTIIVVQGTRNTTWFHFTTFGGQIGTPILCSFENLAVRAGYTCIQTSVAPLSHASAALEAISSKDNLHATTVVAFIEA